MLKHMPQLLSVMTPFPYHIEANQTVDEALGMMHTHDIRHLPVMVEGNIESLISDRDVKRAQLIGHRGAADADMLVGDICPASASYADVHDPLDQVLELMIERRVEAIVVLKDGTPVGIFTDTDACRTLIALLRQVYPEPGADDAA
jgi:acetoin utilization protein AcuB